MPPDGRVLIVGAGGGLEINHLAGVEDGWRFVGVDPAPAMLDLARAVAGPATGDRLTLIEGTIVDAPPGALDAATRLDRYAADALRWGVAADTVATARAAVGASTTTVPDRRKVELLAQAGFRATELFYAGMAWRGWVTCACSALPATRTNGPPYLNMRHPRPRARPVPFSHSQHYIRAQARQRSTRMSPNTFGDPVVILSYARTPMGAFQGALAGATATELGATAVRAAVERAGVDPDSIDKVFMGCVLPAGLGQAPARQAAIGAGLPTSVEATTVNKVCGSGMQAAIFAHDMLAAGSADMIVAGGMESMSNAPYLLKKHRAGARIGHDTAYDHMMLDGLEDAYDAGRAMGTFAEDTSRQYQFTREVQDDYAVESLTRALGAQKSGGFDREIVAVTVKGRKGDTLVEHDEQPAKGDPAKLRMLKAAFAKEGTITAASSSSISDGAAALVLTRESVAAARGLAPIARVVGHAAHAQAPNKFTTAPIGAVEKLLAKTGWRIDEVDLFEVNEAFACVPMAWMKDLGVAHDKVNVHGGATALGHPIGASGARIMATLIAALQTRGAKRGIATLCIGGGEATAIAVELV